MNSPVYLDDCEYGHPDPDYDDYDDEDDDIWWDDPEDEEEDDSDICYGCGLYHDDCECEDH